MGELCLKKLPAINYKTEKFVFGTFVVRTGLSVRCTRKQP